MKNQDGRIAVGESCLKSPSSTHSSEIGCNIPTNSTLPRALDIYKIPQILSLTLARIKLERQKGNWNELISIK